MAGLRRRKGGKAGFENLDCGPSRCVNCRFWSHLRLVFTCNGVGVGVRNQKRRAYDLMKTRLLESEAKSEELNNHRVWECAF